MKAEFKYRNSSGTESTGYMELGDYRLASKSNLTAAGVVNARHADADPRFGSAFVQGCHFLGIFVKGDPALGILPTTVGEALSGDCVQKFAGAQLAGGVIVSPKSPIGGSTPASRIFFPEVITQIISEVIQADYTTEESAWNQMVAVHTSLSSEVWTQPIINTTAPRAQDSRPIGANQMPARMISITASQTSQALGTISIGLEIADQALRDTTIDLIGIIVREQMQGERLRHLWRDINRVVVGNPDARDHTLANSSQALTPVVFKTAYDSTVADNAISDAGWLAALWDPERRFNFNWMLGDLDAYIAVQNRSGRPLAFDPSTSGINRGDSGNYGLSAGTPELINFNTMKPRWMLTPAGVIPAKHILMFDSRYFLGSVTNVSAAYSATEANILTRSNAWRWDSSEFIYRLRDEAGHLLDYSKP
jgi:hypothetical protein